MKLKGYLDHINILVENDKSILDLDVVYLKDADDYDYDDGVQGVDVTPCVTTVDDEGYWDDESENKVFLLN